MFTHLFKLIWNKKKQNFLLIMEMLVSFIVMFAVFTLLVFYFQNYNRQMGFDHENVWTVHYDSPPGISNSDSISDFRASLKQMIKSMPAVEEVSFSQVNIPFGNATISGGIHYDKISTQTNTYTVDDSYRDLLNIRIIEGKWFSKEDAVAKEKPVVITEQLKETLFGKGSAVGKLLADGGTGKMKITGVVNNMKDEGDFTGPKNGLFRRVDTSNQLWDGIILIKVKPTVDASFESHLYKTLSTTFKNTNVEILHMDEQLAGKNKSVISWIIIVVIVAGFLIVNVALGLFGVLWYNINKRKSEIGLRRAVGASGNAVSKQLVAEALVLSTISLIVGSFFAIQFPLMNVFDLATNTYLLALALAIIFIYLLVIICALYPGKQAAAIFPAVALHED
ncbi:FtsX-like permease family protein [soil metagenome]